MRKLTLALIASAIAVSSAAVLVGSAEAASFGGRGCISKLEFIEVKEQAFIIMDVQRITHATGSLYNKDIRRDGSVVGDYVFKRCGGGLVLVHYTGWAGESTRFAAVLGYR
jgi:hypothetical protein